jgi:hypothetical protein
VSCFFSVLPNFGGIFLLIVLVCKHLFTPL